MPPHRPHYRHPARLPSQAQEGARPQLTAKEKRSVLEALKRIESSKAFHGNDHYLECLRFVVKKTLAGCHADELAASRLAVELFDGAKKSNVAPEFGRIRQKLLKYYSVEAPSEPVQIDIPDGGYVPTFWFSSPTSSEIENSVQDGMPRPLPPAEKIGRAS